MSTTGTTVATRAVGRNVANGTYGEGLTASAALVLAQVNAEQGGIFSRLSEAAKLRYAYSWVIASSVAGSYRTVAVSALTPPLEYVRRVELAASRGEIYPVDQQAPDDEIAPRYYRDGGNLVEVGTDWGTTGSVNIRVIGVARFTALTTLADNVGLPDDFTDLLENRLARWINLRDSGRDPGEVSQLDTEYERRLREFDTWLSNQGGPQTVRQALPTPKSKE